MIYKNGYDPNQIEMMCLESEVPMDSPARVISAFVEEVVKGNSKTPRNDAMTGFYDALNALF